MTSFDAVVVGSGPNGLVAATVLARAGKQVLLAESADRIGGGMRTEELTLPGFRHDVCSAVHPFAATSPAMEALELESFGVSWLHHDVVLSHPLAGGDGAAVFREVGRTAEGLGEDAAAYRRRIGALVHQWQHFADLALSPPSRWPALLLQRAPAAAWSAIRFAMASAWPAAVLARRWFATPAGRALVAGCAAHSYVPLGNPATAGFGTSLLALAHTVGWPVARTGSSAIADALASALLADGGRIETGFRVRNLSDLPAARAVLLDLTASNAAAVLGSAGGQGRGEAGSAASRLRSVRPGGSAHKIDYALSAPLPWAHEPSRRSGTVHVGGTLSDIAAAEKAHGAGHLSGRPFLIVSQPTIVDASRAPPGCHIAWVYGHVPVGYEHDATALVEAQLERFAPGFTECVLARSVRGPAELAADNANYTGGDITGGRLDARGLLLRSATRGHPYRLAPGLYLCSASTSPGPGTHGMAGWHAAHAALASELA
ncbi:phytoene desaturase family protein [Candidatus Poriferisodalis sp.]|uniref:phytoene desaturase family protein n=1 Tax=Candidatus Poriferisodalis sp. TaxID=3101277 RepID=UPI003B5B7C18